jgi:hypothetical protein
MTRAQLERALRAAERSSAKASAARRALPAGSSRARVTTANARWMRAAEHRDLLRRQLDDMDAATRCAASDLLPEFA